MKYPLDSKKTIPDTLLFWCVKFVRYKLTSLSNTNVSVSSNLALVLTKISKSSNIEELRNSALFARNIGIIGINTYFNPLYKLYNYLVELNLYSMRDIDEEILSDFLAIHTSSLADASKKNYRIALLNFFSYLDKQNQNNDDSRYAYNVELKNWGGLSGKSGTKLPSYMTKSEIDTFLNAIKTYSFKNSVKYRNSLIIKIILYTGIRVSEAINLKTKDINLQDGLYVLQIRGKGNKPRIVLIKKHIIEDDLREWLGVKKLNTLTLFCTKDGGLMAQAYISRVVEKILMFAGIRKEKNGAHMLRHSFATLLYQKSQDLVLLQEALGHSDINTSRIYTHFDTSKLKATTDIMD
jgi:integrase/recombinase XerD